MIGLMMQLQVRHKDLVDIAKGHQLVAEIEEQLVQLGWSVESCGATVSQLAPDSTVGTTARDDNATLGFKLGRAESSVK